MSINFETLVPFFILGVIGVALVISYLILVNRRRAWTNLAERAGLNIEPGNFFGGGLCVSGVYHSHQLTLDKFTRHHGKSSTTYTRIVLFLNRQAGLQLDLSTEGMFSKIGKLLGMQDIHTGDEALDQRYVIRGQPEDQVTRLLLSYDLRQKLIEAPALHVKINGQEIYYEKSGVETNEDTLLALFDLLTSLAVGVERLGN
jgi:hypothetical protein